ncbi:MAG: hypothetical protein AAF752_13210, partial [Bacteroidota bacterium]
MHSRFRSICLSALVLLLAAPGVAHAQFAKKWLAAGSLHNWYSEIGSEVESGGFVQTQQDGMRWPGIFRFRDAQAAKALWLGAQNVVDENGTRFPVRVVHAGPRVSGAGEFFPVRFEMISRFDPPEVFVDGGVSEPEAFMVNDFVDPSIPADRMIINEVNTLLGISMERKIMQFSQDFHDNYHLVEYTFTNTGNTDEDPEIELPNQTVEGFWAFLQYRWSVLKETRYVIGNPTSWGKNAMNDARGDGVLVDPPDEQFRAQFTWHGNFPAFSQYDNIGGPILPQALPALQIADADTVGRLGADAFVGSVTIRADGAPGATEDDPSQPATTTWFGSDDPFTSQNDAFDPAKMTVEYGLMSAGHKSPRHAYAVEPSGLPGFLNGTGDPSLGTPGGISHANGFGPYTLGPGESISFVIAEGMSGLSREAAIQVGRQFKNGEISAEQKNEIAFSSQDSLFQTFRRAIANYESGYGIPRPPLPPKLFDVNSGGDRISLTWDTFDEGPMAESFEIYRAQGRFDSTYTLIHTAGAGETSFDDTTPIRGFDYYYYIVAVGSPGDNDGTGLTPAGVPLRSSRYYSQTYTPTQLKRPPGESLADFRIVPNPFNISASAAGSSLVRYSDQTDKLGFLNIPGNCRIEIYTELGELVETILHTDG